MGRATRKALGRAVERRVRSMVKSNDKQKERRKSKERIVFSLWRAAGGEFRPPVKNDHRAKFHRVKKKKEMHTI
jgi:hypothetical protein